VNVFLIWINPSVAPIAASCSGANDLRQEFAMIKQIAVAATAVLITASPLAYAAETTSSTTGMRHPLTGADLNALTDARVGMMKAALQLTPEQEKYWPALEAAIRARAKNRQARFERFAELRDRDTSATEALREQNPVELMQRRAEMLTQRGADLKKVADAWEPLYKTLSQDQKKRMAFATFVTGRAMRETIERRLDSEDDDE
jgi:LTXXQ motif family protein